MLGRAAAARTLDLYSDLVDDDLDAVADALDQRAQNTREVRMWANPAANENARPSGGLEHRSDQDRDGAACQNRTDDLLITSEMLYQLS
jgi:hypothetical protein